MRLPLSRSRNKIRHPRRRLDSRLDNLAVDCPRYVGEFWKLGLDMKDICDRVTVEGMIKELMELKKDEFWQRADHLANIAKASVREGGSSYKNLDQLIQEIKSTTFSTLQG
ncbi:7-deoxyloganetic acid glucosyltransferase-like [Olea europaea subsp. europaea]|uniref:7-deoxyloganetic acid glucosyltransferase-like n=1 Tax=Olea europaea subsp. europaea TaxID=158383 RepID=A0A8S0QZN6_OLEEU|nr:7-deoxyloganetic acid glucosyltransferase-like [Olea europaea subsp. europaea]